MTTNVWEDPRVVAGMPRMLALRHGMLEAGAAPVGWKVGFGSPASLELMQITAPLLGFLTDETMIGSGSELSTTGWSRGIVEFEVAVYLGSDVPSGVAPDEARRAVSAVGPAIEVADVDLRPEAERVTDIVAGNVFHKAVIFGERDERRAGLDISGLTATILVDGREQASTTDLQAITGEYPWILTVVADTLASVGERLAAGDVIITGSVIPPIPVTEGTRFDFRLGEMTPIAVLVT